MVNSEWGSRKKEDLKFSGANSPLTTDRSQFPFHEFYK